MWFDPDEVEREEREFKNKRLFERLDKEVEESSEEEEAIDGDETTTGRKEKRKEKSELDYLRGKSDTVVDDPEDERVRHEMETEVKEKERREQKSREQGLKKEEKEEWFSMDVSTRLALTLSYLRHHYQ